MTASTHVTEERTRAYELAYELAYEVAYELAYELTYAYLRTFAERVCTFGGLAE